MLTLPFMLIILLSIIIGIIGLLAYLRNTKNNLNKLFLVFTFSLILWLLSNYLSSTAGVTHIISLWANRITLIAGLICILMLYGFILQLSNLIYKNRLFRILTLFVLIVSLLCLSKLIVNDVYVKDEDVINIFGILAPVYFFTLFLTTLIFIITLIYANIKSFGQLKKQLQSISFSFILVVIIVIIGNAILPIFNNYTFVNYTPFSVVMLILSMSFAISKYKLFEIKRAITRSFSYVISLSILLLLFGIITHQTNKLVIGEINAGSLSSILNILVIAIIIIIFNPIKKYFDKVTNSIFYRDAYDPQEVLNKLNAQLVKSNSIDELARASIDIIQDNLHPQFVCFAFLDSGNKFIYYYGNKKVKLTDLEEQNLSSFVASSSSRTIIADEFAEEHHINAKRIYNKYQIALTTKLIAGDDVVGFEILGDRKSGNAYGNRDVQLLETAADSIAIAAQNALRYDEIAAFNITLQKRVEDATLDLQKSNDKLKALDDAKDEFISMASHQLRTPLTSIKGYISMLLEGDGGKVNELQRKFLDQAYVSSQRMVYLIADLLNVSRVKTGKFVIESKPTYLPDVVTSELGQLTETAKARGLKLVFALPPANFPMLNLDDTKIRQVIMNFADNAIYYTPKGGTITVALAATNDAVECTVSDTGIGVPIHDQHHLFTKFYRAGNAKKARPDGTGLGLFMAKKVIAAQGGALIFKSTEGKGSVFGFSFPRAKLEVAESPGIKNDNI